MRVLFLILFFAFNSFYDAAAQSRQDLFVTVTDNTWNIAHTVQKGETVFMLARRYHVPPAILADANNLSYQDHLKEFSTVTVPLGAYNLQTQKPVNMAEARALYYKVTGDDNLYRISRHAGVPQRTLAQLNNLQNNEVTTGQKILVGWVLYDATQASVAMPTTTTIPKPTTVVKTSLPAVRPAPPVVVNTQVPVRNDSVIPEAVTNINTDSMPSLPPVVTLKDLFDEQTMQEQNLVWEKGTAAFFSMTTQAKGASVYAFHNKASKGSVIRVKNMNNGKIVYVKVLGPMPNTKQYYNCIIGLSGSAKAALGVRDDKAFCELSYAGY